MRRLALFCCLIAGLLVALPAGAVAAKRPIVYVVVIDGLDGDKVEAGRAPFLSSLIAGQGARATYFPRSSSVLPAETNPNHTAMMSGAYPGSSGIAANAFAIYAPLRSEDGCVRRGPFDLRSLPNETSGESRTCPQAEFTFEAIKRQGNPDGLRTAAIFGKPKLGRIFAGRNFRRNRRDVDHLWAPCDNNAADDDGYCEKVNTNPITGYAADDSIVMDEVIETIDQGVGPGKRRRPDLTFVNLPQVDSAGHALGTTALGLYDTAIGMADDQIERLVAKLRARGEWKRTVLIVTSDHSMDTTPLKISLTEQFEGAGIPEESFLAVDNGSVDFIYLANRKAASRHKLLRQMRQVALATPGVAAAYYRRPNPADGGRAHTLDMAHPAWRAAGPRTGDLFVISEPGTAFSDPTLNSNPLPGNHGAPQTADNFLMVASGGELVRQARPSQGRRARATNADLAATAMGAFGLFAPADNQGRFLSAAFNRRALARVSRPHRPQVRVIRSLAMARAAAKARNLPGARHARSRVLELVLAPAGGRYDLQVRRGNNWKPLLRRAARNTVPLRGVIGRRYRLRARSRSAADIPSRWRVRRVRF